MLGQPSKVNQSPHHITEEWAPWQKGLDESMFDALFSNLRFGL